MPDSGSSIDTSSRALLTRSRAARIFIAGAVMAGAGWALAKPYGPGTGTAAAHMSSSAAMMCESKSPAHTVALVELFTSEGCSSCPPADRWLQSLPRQGLGFDKLVPLALHVGYWDYIGWKDPYAQAQFTERQREYARLRQASNVYTPQIVLNGDDFRGWGDAPLARTLGALATRPAGAAIELDASAVGSAVRIRANAQLRPATDPALPTRPATGAPSLHLALFEMGLKSQVMRGENSGSTLAHDFVVRQWQGPIALSQGKASVSDILTLAAPSNGRSLGVAAFVQNERGDVLQATACLMR